MLFETSLSSTPVFGLRREMNRLFDDMLTRTTPTAAWMPAVDVREDQKDIAIQAELPGVRPEDVEVTSDNGLLTIRGQKTISRQEGDQTQYHLVERSYGSFSRSFRLPKGVDESKITASFDHGILTVRVPKTALPQPRKIEIGGSGSNEQPQVQGTAPAASNGSSANANA